MVWAPHLLEIGQFGGLKAWSCALGHFGVCSNIKKQFVTKGRHWDELWQPLRAVTALGLCHPQPSMSAGKQAGTHGLNEAQETSEIYG